MRRLRNLVLALAAVTALAACDRGWAQPDAGPDRQRSNPQETSLTPANVASLTQAFHVDGPTGAPVVQDGVLVGASGNTLYAVDAKTGSTRWTHTAAGTITSDLVIDGDYVVYSYDDPSGKSYEQHYELAHDAALDAPLPTIGPMAARRDGSSVRIARVYDSDPRDVLQVGGKAMYGQAEGNMVDGVTYGSRYVYAVTDQHFTAPSLSIQAFDPDTPCTNDSCTSVWSNGLGYAGTPAIGNDGTLFVPGGNGGRIGYRYGQPRAVDGTTGETKWTLADSDLTQVAVAGKQVFFSGPGTSDAGQLDAVDASDGSIEWRANGANGNPAVAGGVVYVNSDSTIKAYAAAGCGAATCDPIWTGTASAPVTGLAVTGGRLYVGTTSGIDVFARP